MITVDEALDRDMALTDEEYFRVHGTLNVARIEGLLRMVVCVEGSEAVRPMIEDAIASFPDEDFLEPVITKLRALWNKIPDRHRSELTRITAELEEVQTATWRSAEYGVEQLESAESLIYIP
jgi:hypothetical protein